MRDFRVGDRVVVLPSEEHSHGNKHGVIVEIDRKSYIYNQGAV